VREFIADRPWLIALLAGSLVQIMKFAADWVRYKRPNFRVLTSTGGMPSSHSAGVCALTTAIYVTAGGRSPLFSVALYFSLIVMYDATGLRRSAGLQAAILNRIVDEQFIHHRKAGEGRLKELLGHTPLEVLVGAILGILFALSWYPSGG
jgi:acid phosphatase family membrane protein YuiD